MRTFTYETSPARIIFGSGTVAGVGGEVARLGLRRALVLSTPAQRPEAQRLAELIGDRAVGVIDEARMHTPIEVTESVLARAEALDADGFVAVGGGSTIGLGKALAARTGLPQIVVPTTYAGSEMTPILGETVDGLKSTRRGPEILPEVVIYDVDLTLTLPPALSATSGINAIAHAVEALYAVDGNPVISLMAEEGIAALARALPEILADAGDREARGDALYGAWLCGACLGAVGMALHHKLCHTIGGTFDLPHAETHTVVLPHAVAYNAQFAPAAMARIATALGADNAAQGLYDLAGRLGAERALRGLGMPQHGIARAADLASANPYPNPRPIDRNALQELITRAWSGDPPRP